MNADAGPCEGPRIFSIKVKFDQIHETFTLMREKLRYNRFEADVIVRSIVIVYVIGGTGYGS